MQADRHLRQRPVQAPWRAQHRPHLRCGPGQGCHERFSAEGEAKPMRGYQKLTFPDPDADLKRGGSGTQRRRCAVRSAVRTGSTVTGGVVTKETPPLHIPDEIGVSPLQTPRLMRRRLILRLMPKPVFPSATSSTPTLRQSSAPAINPDSTGIHGIQPGIHGNLRLPTRLPWKGAVTAGVTANRTL